MLSIKRCGHTYWILCNMVRPNHCHKLTTGLRKCWYRQLASLLRTRLNWQNHHSNESLLNCYSYLRHQPSWLRRDRVRNWNPRRLWWNHWIRLWTWWIDHWIQSLWGAWLKTWIATPLLCHYPKLQVPSCYLHPEPSPVTHGDTGCGWLNPTAVSRLLAKHYHLARGR